MGVTAVHAAARTVKWLILAGSALLVAVIMSPGSPLVIAAFVFCAVVLAYLTDGFGALLAALAVGAEITEIRFGTPRPAIRFRVQGAQVSLGLPGGYWIGHRPVSTSRHAVLLLGGALANLTMAGIAQALPLPSAIASSLTVIFVAHAVEQLIPLRWKDGRESPGDQLVHLRSHRLLLELDDMWASRDSPALSPDRTDRVLTAFREGDVAARLNAHLLAMMLRREGRVAELMEVHAASAEPNEKLDEAYRGAFAELEWHVLAVPGLPAAEADRAAARLEGLPRFSRPDRRISLATTLALARLRQGRFAEVEPLCADALAGELEPDQRAHVLATVALARRALGQPYAELIAEAERLTPDDDLVAEAAAPRLAGTHLSAAGNDENLSRTRRRACPGSLFPPPDGRPEHQLPPRGHGTGGGARQPQHRLPVGEQPGPH
jgi:hypothetical protein